MQILCRNRYLYVERPEKGLPDAKQGVKLLPKSGVSWFWRGEIYQVLGQYKKAMSDYNKAIQLTPTRAYFVWKRGRAYEKSGKVNLAIADYKKTQQLKPLNFEDREAQIHAKKRLLDLKIIIKP